MTGSFDKMSILTLGISPKKKMAKRPAAPPKPAAVIPLNQSAVNSSSGESLFVHALVEHVVGNLYVQLGCATHGDAVEVGSDLVAITSASELSMSTPLIFLCKPALT